jgi:hypothetical protein
MKKIWLFIGVISSILFVGSTFPALIISASYLTTDLQIGFPITLATPNGAIRILIPTATDSSRLADSTGAWNSGAPVPNGLVVSSLDASEVEIICPTTTPDTTGLIEFTPPGEYLGSIFYNDQAERELTLAEAEGEIQAGRNIIRYLGFLCRYTGPGTIGGHFTLQKPESNILLTNLVNPLAPPNDPTATINQAVTLPAKVQLLSSGYNGHDGQPASTHLLTNRDVLISTFIQEVRITARIDEQLTFRLDGVTANQTICGDKTTTVATAPLTVNYLSLPLNQFVNAGQKLLIISSARNGYVVTLSQDKLMSRQTGNCPANGLVAGSPSRDCIQNFGYETNLTPTSAQSWTSAQKTGLGYTVKVAETPVNSHPQAHPMFQDGKNYSRFATSALDEDPIPVVSSSTIARGDVYDLCYRLAVGENAAAGTYTNNLTYTLTASF